MTEYFIINSGVNHIISTDKDKKVLYTIHNAGFFSNCTIRLMDIVWFFNTQKQLPDEVHSETQFINYKVSAGDNLVPYFFTETDASIDYKEDVNMRWDCMAIQFDKYSNLDFKALKPFVDKYFAPGKEVVKAMEQHQAKYRFKFDKLCAVFYRGNDKAREMTIPSYEVFIGKAKEIKAADPDIRFLIQPDETEFLEVFLREFPDTIYIDETGHIPKQDSAVFIRAKDKHKAEHAKHFFASVVAMSKCKHVITHSGNGALWLALYRGNANNIHQWFNGKWL